MSATKSSTPASCPGRAGSTTSSVARESHGLSRFSSSVSVASTTNESRGPRCWRSPSSIGDTGRSASVASVKSAYFEPTESGTSTWMLCLCKRPSSSTRRSCGSRPDCIPCARRLRCVGGSTFSTRSMMASIRRGTAANWLVSTSLVRRWAMPGSPLSTATSASSSSRSSSAPFIASSSDSAM